MKGAFCVNQWLEKEGYLTLEEKPTSVVDLDKAKVDWGRTKAWGWGGYYARIFFNVKGREAQGVIEPGDLPAIKRELRERLMTIEDPEGRVMKNVVFEPEEKYGVANGDRPDLMVYFDDLDWRSAGTLGHPSIYLDENDTGPDDSVHSMHGVIIFRGRRDDQRQQGSDLGEVNTEDIAPTILGMFGITAPSYMRGRTCSSGEGAAPSGGYGKASRRPSRAAAYVRMRRPRRFTGVESQCLRPVEPKYRGGGEARHHQPLTPKIVSQ